VADALGRLPASTRERLEQFSQALERIPVDDLQGFAVRTREPEHGRAIDSAERAVREAGLDEPLDAVRSVIGEFVARA
jgi:hypothetical protein